MQRPQVRPVRNPVRRELVVASVPREKRHRPARDVGDDERRAGRAVGRVDQEVVAAVEQRVEAGAADDGDVRGALHQPHRSFFGHGYLLLVGSEHP